jgi:Na+/H+ antiporter NhaD/arsenite permease-like protein
LPIGADDARAAVNGWRAAARVALYAAKSVQAAWRTFRARRETHLSALKTALHRLKHDRLLQALLLLTAALAILDPRPARAYLPWLDVPTLAGLTGLLVLTQGVRISGAIQRWALHLVARLHNVRVLAVVLMLLSAVLASMLTNDVALFLVVPLTLAVDGIAKIPRQRLVIFEALAVNAGSTFSPIGNPQNLLLWQHSGLSFPGFVAAVAPAGAILLGMVLLLCVLAFPAAPLQFDEHAMEPPPLNAPLAIASTVLLAGMVAALQWGCGWQAALAVLVIGALFFRRALLGVDWMLLVTFAAMFVGLGHLAAVPAVDAHLHAFDWRDPRVLYGGGIVLSQLISNVPAAVLLQHYTHDLTLLAVAVNVGGSGLMIGSLANLIALRLDGSRRIAWKFHAWSVPFLLVAAVLVGLWAMLQGGS